MAKEKFKCAICGKETDCTAWDEESSHIKVYLERGISKKDFLCDTCYQKKIIVCDYNCDEKKRNAAISYLEKKITNKSITIQNVVKAWINGEDQNCYTSAEEPVYYVEGPKASLFVFENHVTILSSFQPYENKEMLDYVYFYRCKARVSARKVTEVKEFFAHYLEEHELSDSGKINAKYHTENIERWSQQPIELNVSLGEYGTLDFGKKDSSWDTYAYSFKFYYHQNQLMEEIYNYIQSRIANSDVAASVQESNNAQSKVSKTVETPAGKPTEESGTSFSAADEIRKMKELFDCGIISQEEFDEAKKRLISKL